MPHLIRLKVATLQSQPRSSSIMMLNAKLKNVTYAKDVFVHYKSYPFWQDAPLVYKDHFGDYDLFELPPGTTPYFNEFVLYCKQGNTTDWDNNDGRNYLLNSDQTIIGGNVVLNSAKAQIHPIRGGITATANGTIYVNNRSYQKQVGIVYSINGSGPWLECTATYKGQVLYFGAESWEFTVPAFSINNTITNYLKFAVFYKNIDNNVTYWDNNFWQDYILPLMEESEID